jgi:cell fate (sporulation/competence/biofilm development) regulator YmcA (YheA/YmcA/DUF963 family)
VFDKLSALDIKPIAYQDSNRERPANELKERVIRRAEEIRNSWNNTDENDVFKNSEPNISYKNKTIQKANDVINKASAFSQNNNKRSAIKTKLERVPKDTLIKTESRDVKKKIESVIPPITDPIEYARQLGLKIWFPLEYWVQESDDYDDNDRQLMTKLNNKYSSITHEEAERGIKIYSDALLNGFNPEE